MVKLMDTPGFNGTSHMRANAYLQLCSGKENKKFDRWLVRLCTEFLIFSRLFVSVRAAQ